MLSFQEAMVNDPLAEEILTEYFASRAAEFPGGTYSPTFPSTQTFVPPAGVFLLVERQGSDTDRTAIGCGGVRRIDDGPSGVRYEVKHLFLRPDARGHGAGKALLGALEGYARKWDASELVLDTHHTLTAAAGLYISSGFVAVEPYNDNPNATRWYRKSLLPIDRGE